MLRAQPLVSSRAARHPAYIESAWSRLIDGSNRRSSCHMPATSDRSLKIPVESPAMSMVPKTVASAIFGRTTGMPRMSACSWQRKLFFTAPPSTRSSGMSMWAPPCTAASTTSRVW